MFKKVSDPRYYAWILVVAALTLPGAPVHKSAAQSVTVLRFASLVPPGSPFMKVLKAWNRSVQEQTEGRVQLRFYSGGSQGDERDYVRKMRAGQLDAAAISSIGLGMLARPILVLSAPGVIHNYEELGRVQKSLSPRFEQMIDEAGFQLLAWGTSGEVRLFSKQRIEAPDDLKKVFDSTAARAHELLNKTIRKDDQKAYDVILKKGIVVVDPGDAKAEWDAAHKKVRDNLTGRVFSKSLLDAVAAASKP